MLRKMETMFYLGATVFLCWSLAAQLDGFMPTDMIFASLLNFTSRDDGSSGRHHATSIDLSNRVYVVEDPAAGSVTVSDWNQLSNEWGSNSSYSDLLKSTKRVHVLPHQLHSERIIFIWHTHPKMASTTLRRGCWENLRSTCNVVSPKRDPKGYSNTDELAALIDECVDTHHFCVMGWHFGVGNFPNITSSSSKLITFIHMFPFRRFDEWAVSAMKQVFVGHSEAGCNAAAQRLEKCDGWLELDFTKYSKMALSKMLGIMKRRGDQSPTHHVFLYDYSQVHPTLEQLCHAYKVPALQYLNLQYKQIRQDGSCPNETLQKFHDCFDEQLLLL